jgi:hypothetical protein
MPRDPSGNYTYPPGTPGIPDQTIVSAKYNGYLDDVAQDLNSPRPIIAGGTGAVNADNALANLGGEKANQLVANYNSHIFYPGSFRSVADPAGSNGAPVANHAFAGFVTLNEPLVYPPTNANIVLEARDTSDTTAPGRLYVREKKAGVWGDWKLDGRTVTGDADGIGADAADMFFGLRGTAPSSRFVVNTESDVSGTDVFAVTKAGAATFTGTVTAAGVTTAGTVTAGAVAAGSMTIGGAAVATQAYVNSGDNAKLNLTGGTMTGVLTSVASAGYIQNSVGAAGFEQRGAGGGSGAYMSFHRPGEFAAHFGVDTDNQWKVGGWSMGVNAYRVVHEGLANPTFNGTGYAGAFSAPNIYATTFHGTLSGSITGNANYANSAGSAGYATTAGGLTAGASLNLAWIEGPECIDMKTWGSVADYDCRFYLQYPNLNISGGPGFDTVNYYTRLKAHSHFTAEQGFLGRVGVDIGGLTNWQFNWGGALQGYLGNSYLGVVFFSSDYRMKKDIAPLTSTWDRVKLLKPISYTHKDFDPPCRSKSEDSTPLMPGDDIERWGFVAHELQETLIPSAASATKDAPDAVQQPNPWPVLATLTKALQEAMARIEALEAALVARTT